MSPRFYIISAIIVLTLTAAVSIWREKKTNREIFAVLCQVVLALAIIFGIMLGFAELLEMLGIAKSGFV